MELFTLYADDRTSALSSRLSNLLCQLVCGYYYDSHNRIRVGKLPIRLYELPKVVIADLPNH